ncbi:MAG: hypothetical protein WBZ04_07945 [Candidatus Nanopelagicales bacterium]
MAGWIYKGFIGVWLTCAFAALYPSTPTGRIAPPTQEDQAAA